MKRLSFILIMFIYLLIYQLFLISYGEIIRYIINPLVWILFALISYFINNKQKRIYKYFYDIIYIVIIGALIYIILFYTIGFFIGYTNNPYSLTISGFIINAFIILLVLGLKEYIRNILIWQIDRKRFLYLSLIFLLFVLSDLNWYQMIISFNDILSVFRLITKDIIPIISINLLMMYLSINSGYLPAIIYRILIFLPNLILPIVPKYDWFILSLFDILFPLFIFSITKYKINKKSKMMPKEINKPLGFKNFIILSLLVMIIMFGLGVFGSKPFVILSGSMRPTINEGDLVIIEKVKIENIKAGDIIQYKTKDYSVVHRVVKILKDNQEILLITKGDNNLKNDSKPINKKDLLGRVKWRIPFIGYPSYIIQKILGINRRK